MTNTGAALQIRQVADQFNTILFGANADTTMFYGPIKKPSVDLDSTVVALAALVDKPDDHNLISTISDMWKLSEERVRLLGKLVVLCQERNQIR